MTQSGSLSEEERWIGSLLLRHIQLLQFNAHEVSELEMIRPNEMNGAKSVFIGAAVYPTVFLCFSLSSLSLAQTNFSSILMRFQSIRLITLTLLKFFILPNLHFCRTFKLITA